MNCNHFFSPFFLLFFSFFAGLFLTFCLHGVTISKIMHGNMTVDWLSGSGSSSLFEFVRNQASSTFSSRLCWDLRRRAPCWVPRRPLPGTCPRFAGTSRESESLPGCPWWPAAPGASPASAQPQPSLLWRGLATASQRKLTLEAQS